MPVSYDSRLHRCIADDWGWAAHTGSIQDTINAFDAKEHRWPFAHGFNANEKKMITGVVQWIRNTEEKLYYARATDKVTVTNEYRESILIIALFKEDVLFHVDSDEDFEEDSDFDKFVIVGPRQSIEIDPDIGFFSGSPMVIVPFVVSLNATINEVPKDDLFNAHKEYFEKSIPRTFQQALDEYPDWKAYFEQTALNVVNMDNWNPSRDFWATGGEIPMYDAKTGQITTQGLDEWEATYGSFTPTGDTPKPPIVEEEPDYTLWIVGGLIIIGIILVIYLSRSKTGVKSAE